MGCIILSKFYTTSKIGKLVEVYNSSQVDWEILSYKSGEVLQNCTVRLFEQTNVSTNIGELKRLHLEYNHSDNCIEHATWTTEIWIVTLMSFAIELAIVGCYICCHRGYCNLRERESSQRSNPRYSNSIVPVQEPCVAFPLLEGSATDVEMVPQRRFVIQYRPSCRMRLPFRSFVVPVLCPPCKEDKCSCHMGYNVV